MLNFGNLPYKSYNIYHFDFLELMRYGERIDDTLIINESKSEKLLINSKFNKLDKKGECHLFDQTKKALKMFIDFNNDLSFTNIYIVIDFNRYLKYGSSKNLYSAFLQIRNGIKLFINGEEIHFVDFMKSSSMSKNCCMMYVNKKYKPYLEPRFTFGLNKNSYVLAKWYAYSGLAISDATIIESIRFNKDEIVVVPDQEVNAYIDCITAVSVDYLQKVISSFSDYVKDIDKFNEFIDSSKSLEDNSIILKSNNLPLRTKNIIKEKYSKIDNIKKEIKCFHDSSDYVEVPEYQLSNLSDGSNDIDAVCYLIEYFSKIINSHDNISDIRKQLSILNDVLSKYREKNQEVKWFKFNVKNLPSSINKFDGQGLISKELCQEINSELKKLTKKKNQKFGFTYQIRLPFIKGIVNSCDFKTFFKEKGIKYIYGKTYSKSSDQKPYKPYDVNKVKVILTESQFKCKDIITDNIETKGGETPFDAFMRLLNEYNYCLGVSNLEPEHKKRVNLNYQFLSTLPISNGAKRFITNINFCDFRQSTKIESVAKKIIRENPTEEDKYLYKHFPKIYMSTNKFRNKRNEISKNHLSQYYSLNYSAKGYRKYLCSDLLELLYHTAYHFSNKKPKVDYLPLNKFYAPGTTFTEGEKCILLRNPHYSRNEIAVLKNSLEKDTERGKYFSHLSGVLMFNPLSLTAQRLGGADFDGDTVVVLSEQYFSKTISRLFNKERRLKYPLVSIPSLTAKKTNFREYENRARSISDTFNSRVGLISNIALSEAFNAYDTRTVSTDGIAFYTLLNGLEIDSAKNGVKPNLLTCQENRLAREFLTIKEEIAFNKSKSTDNQQIKFKNKNLLPSKNKKFVLLNKNKNAIYDMLSRAFNFKLAKAKKVSLKRIYNVSKIDKEDLLKVLSIYSTYRIFKTVIGQSKYSIFMYNATKEDYSYNKAREILMRKYPEDFSSESDVVNLVETMNDLIDNPYELIVTYCSVGENKYHYLSNKNEKVNFIKNKLGLNDLSPSYIDVLTDFKDEGYLLLFLILYVIYNLRVTQLSRNNVNESLISDIVEKNISKVNRNIRFTNEEIELIKENVKNKYLHIVNKVEPTNLSFKDFDDLKLIEQKMNLTLKNDSKELSFEPYVAFNEVLEDDFVLDVFIDQLIDYLKKHKDGDLYG